MKGHEESCCEAALFRRVTLQLNIPTIVALAVVLVISAHLVDMAVFGSQTARIARLQREVTADQRALASLDMREIKQNLEDCASLHETNGELIQNIMRLDQRFADLERKCGKH